MFRKTFSVLLVALLLAGACSAGLFGKKKKNTNPLQDVNSKQPDKVLYDRAMDAMKHSKYDLARLTLQTLINTYPDSEYIARAKLSIGDAWYNEGGTAALAQAEIEYKDFITFFPNMPEAAEAQLKVANIHYREMEKADRDITHARRAEDEYRQLILQFPDSKLVPQAEQRLREVQEVLADREFRIGKFYINRESYPAGIARLESMVDIYPLYSQADEALFMIGNAYEREADNVRNARGINEYVRGKMVQEFSNKAVVAYDRILTRYPLEGRADDAKHRLQALKKPIPTPTKEAIAEDKAELESRSSTGTVGKMMGNFKHGPDVAAAAKVGKPTMDPAPETSAVDLVRDATNILASASTGPSTVTLQTVPKEGVTESQPPPHSEPTPAPEQATAPAPSTNSDPNIGEIPVAAPAATEPPPPVTTSTGSAASSATTDSAAALPPLTQANDASSSNSDSSASAQSGDKSSDSDKGVSSSKKKKKKGLHKLIPF